MIGNHSAKKRKMSMWETVSKYGQIGFQLHFRRATFKYFCENPNLTLTQRLGLT